MSPLRLLLLDALIAGLHRLRTATLEGLRRAYAARDRIAAECLLGPHHE